MNYLDPISGPMNLPPNAPVFAGIQMTSQHTVSHCLEIAAQAIATAAQAQAQVVVLPENFATLGTGASQTVAREESESGAQTLLHWCQQQARLNQVYLVAGTMPVWQPNSNLNRARLQVFDPQGMTLCQYDKIHLFDADVADRQGQYRESDHYESGTQVVCWDLPLPTDRPLRIGVAVCYDLRFPELFQKLRDLGAEVVLVPSAFTMKTGAAHWELLLRARAVEQGVFVFGVNQCGWHDDKRQTWGHSAWISPWGDVLSHLGADPGIIYGRFDRALLDRYRQQMPIHQHHRLL